MNLKIKIPFDVKKIKNICLFLLTERSFWCFAFLALLLFAYAAYLFYFYALAVPPPLMENKEKLNPATYQKVIERLNQRDADLRRGAGQDYPDVFR